MNIKKAVLPVQVFILIIAGALPLTAQSADQIMRAYFDVPEPDTQISTATMVLREADGAKITRVMDIYLRKTGAGTDNFMEFVSPADVKGTRFLTIGNKAGSDDQRLWLPALHKTRKIASSDKGANFMGSDLSYYDMGSRDFSDATYNLSGEETLTVIMGGTEKQTSCWIIESTYIDPDSPYSKSRNWISKDNNYIYRTKMWDKNGKELKDIYIVETAVINNIIIKIKILVVNTNGHKTLMIMGDPKVNVPIDPGIFTVKNLEK